MSDEQFLTELRTELVAAAERMEADKALAPSPGRRQPRIWTAVAAAVAVIVAGAVFVLQPAPASAGVDIVFDSNGVSILLTDLDTRADEVIEAVTAAGLDVTVDEVPVGPSRVGKFTSASSSGISPEQLIIGGDTASGFSGVRLPLDFDGELHLSIGRPAGDGETWAFPSDATAPGELLACEELVGTSLETVMERIGEIDVDDVRVMLVDDGEWLDRDRIDALGSTTVISIISPEEGQIWIDTTNDPDFYSATARPEGC